MWEWWAREVYATYSTGFALEIREKIWLTWNDQKWKAKQGNKKLQWKSVKFRKSRSDIIKNGLWRTICYGLGSPRCIICIILDAFRNSNVLVDQIWPSFFSFAWASNCGVSTSKITTQWNLTWKIRTRSLWTSDMKSNPMNFSKNNSISKDTRFKKTHFSTFIRLKTLFFVIQCQWFSTDHNFMANFGQNFVLTISFFYVTT